MFARNSLYAPLNRGITKMLFPLATCDSRYPKLLACFKASRIGAHVTALPSPCVPPGTKTRQRRRYSAATRAEQPMSMSSAVVVSSVCVYATLWSNSGHIRDTICSYALANEWRVHLSGRGPPCGPRCGQLWPWTFHTLKLKLQGVAVLCYKLQL